MTSVPLQQRDTKTRQRLQAQRKGSSLTPLKIQLTREWWRSLGFDKMPIQTVLKNNQEFEDRGIGFTPSLYEQSRTMQIREHMKVYSRLHKLMQQKELTLHDSQPSKKYQGQEYYQYLSPQAIATSVLNLHWLGFIGPISIIGSNQQQKKWLTLAKDIKIIGCYAQTQLGHGSDVMSLETTATYDPKEQVFILNSPTLTSTKFWPGLMGRISNHALVMAQLIINGEKKGVQSFIVNHRDTSSHQPMPGVECGDIGQKIALHQSDNGWMRFSNVKVPRENMLCRFAQVAPDGTYTPPNKKENKLVYAGMLTIRVYFTAYSSWHTACSCIVAIRYSVMRTQFKLKKGSNEERKLLDYQTQQAKLFPILASAWAFVITSFRIRRAYNDFFSSVNQKHTGQKDEFQKGAFHLLPDLHSTVSAGKAFMTDICLEHINVALHACGGHGFLQQSGFPNYWRSASAYPTMQGDNTVLYQQTARYLMKVAQNQDKIRQGADVSYFKERDAIMDMKIPDDATSEFLMSRKIIVNCFRKRVFWQMDRVSQIFAKEMGNGLDMLKIWNEKAQTQLVKMAEYHIASIVVDNFYDRVEQLKDKGIVTQVFGYLRDQFTSWLAKRQAGSLLASGALSAENMEQIHNAWIKSLSDIRPHAVAIVDSFGIRPGLLQSNLGHQDGGIYEKMMHHVKYDTPTSHLKKYPGFDKYLKPFIQPKL